MDPHWLIEKYYVRNSVAYNTLLEHSTLVTNLAVETAKKHPELNADIEFIREAATLHDIGIIFTHAPAIGCHGDYPYICHGYLGNDILMKAGLPMHARVCERHTGTGLSKDDIISQELPLPHRNMQPETIEEQMICFADKFYSKGDISLKLKPDQIRSHLARYGEDKAMQFDIWLEMFG